MRLENWLWKEEITCIIMNGIIPEMEQIISQLERGTIVTTFFKRLEKKTLMIRRETRQIVWSQSATIRPFDGTSKLHKFLINLLFIGFSTFIQKCAFSFKKYWCQIDSYLILFAMETFFKWISYSFQYAIFKYMRNLILLNSPHPWLTTCKKSIIFSNDYAIFC